jgi:hypothetical protein
VWRKEWKGRVFHLLISPSRLPGIGRDEGFERGPKIALGVDQEIGADDDPLATA